MKNSLLQLLAVPLGLFCFLVACLFARFDSQAAGVTVITHGYDGDVSGWITAMADEIPAYPTFPGTNYTIYQITLTTDGTSYYYQWTRSAGAAPSNTDSGEIIVKLDWSQMAGNPFDSSVYDITTANVAPIAAYVLSQTNAISDLAGHALAEYPIHLIGHSRGGSLMSELSRVLGTNGIWVDQLTTLDPHPLNNDGFHDSPITTTDAPAHFTYVNVLFADNYWQNLGNGTLDPDGEQVSGAYVRQFTDLDGGYANSPLDFFNDPYEYHSNVHLWYYGTLDGRTPASYDLNGDIASITSTERQTWWANYEQEGTNAGFLYSLIGGGDRLTTNQPLGATYPAIRSGYNQIWNLGAGLGTNRTALATNTGNWPNLIKFNPLVTNQFNQGQSISLNLFYQWARPIINNATISLYLDDDLNPLNHNQTLLQQSTFAATGSPATLGLVSLTVPLSPTNASPGWHSLLAAITAGGLTRYLYSPEWIQVLPVRQPPALDFARLSPSQFRISINGLIGQTVILQTSPDLLNWQPLATNTLSSDQWLYINTPPPETTTRFYRAALTN